MKIIEVSALALRVLGILLFLRLLGNLLGWMAATGSLPAAAQEALSKPLLIALYAIPLGISLVLMKFPVTLARAVNSTQVTMRAPVLLASLLLSGCVTAPISSAFDGTYRVWPKGRTPLKEAAAPAGFSVTPAEAYKIATDGRLDKMLWNIYADKRCYFLVRVSLVPIFSSSAHARMYGVRVHGTGGKVRECR